MCIAGIEAELAVLIARKQAADAAELKAKAATAQARPQPRLVTSTVTVADKTVPTFRRLPAT